MWQRCSRARLWTACWSSRPANARRCGDMPTAAAMKAQLQPTPRTQRRMNPPQVDLVQMGQKVEDEKDRLLERVSVWRCPARGPCAAWSQPALLLGRPPSSCD